LSRRKEKKKSHKILKTILALLILVFVALAGFVSYSTYRNGWGWSGILATMMGHDSTTVENLEEFKILLMGVSTDISSKLTDTIMIATYNPKTQKATLLSIPRDTYIGTNTETANSYSKINALYQKGPEKTLDAVNEITGLDIKYYAVIDTQALIKVVDAIGGVEFDVPINMNYDDPTQNLAIHLQAGVQKLDGAKAEQLLRFRHNNDGTSYSSAYGDNDIGRMRTQREFMMTVAKQTLQLKNVLKINELIDIAYEYLETNVKVSNIKDYVPYALEFSTDNIETATLPGTTATYNKLSFYVYDKTKTKKLIQEMYYSDDTEDSDSSTATTATTTVSKTEASKVKIELLNGSGDSTKLTTVTNLLKKKGYNVYKTGTTSTATTTTIIENEDVDDDIVANLKELLGTGTVSDTATSSTGTDITIIIGKDYK
jgi:LCP family protein required for cell wall assembly